MNEYDKAVAKGAKLLTEKLPNWEQYVSVEALDLSDPDFCIIGQCCGGGYNQGLEDLGLLDQPLAVTEHGLEAKRDGMGFIRPSTYKPLQAAWKRYLKKAKVKP